MKCIYIANEILEMRIDGELVVVNSGDIIDIPFIPNDKVKMLFPYKEPEAKKPEAKKPEAKKPEAKKPEAKKTVKKTSFFPKKSTKKKKR